MLDFNDLPIDCLYPQVYYPPIDDVVIARVDALFTIVYILPNKSSEVVSKAIE